MRDGGVADGCWKMGGREGRSKDVEGIDEFVSVSILLCFG